MLLNKLLPIQNCWASLYTKKASIRRLSIRIERTLHYSVSFRKWETSGAIRRDSAFLPVPFCSELFIRKCLLKRVFCVLGWKFGPRIMPSGFKENNSRCRTRLYLALWKTVIKKVQNRAFLSHEKLIFFKKRWFSEIIEESVFSS